MKNINNTLLIYNWWLCFLHIYFLFNFLAHKHRLDGGVDFKAQILKLFLQNIC